MDINGKSPINCLTSNIIDTFENMNEHAKELLSRAVANGRVNPEIDYINDKKFRTPYVSLNNGTMSLQESFLCFMWCISYFIFFLSEELNKEQEEDGVCGAFDLNKTPERTRAFNLFNWGVSIQKEWTDWDISLPNPQSCAELTDLEKSYICKVNNIFCHGVAFVLFHEFAHLNLDHSKSDGEWSKLQEKEADQYAREVS